jgi:hypothetical protein
MGTDLLWRLDPVISSRPTTQTPQRERRRPASPARGSSLAAAAPDFGDLGRIDDLALLAFGSPEIPVSFVRWSNPSKLAVRGASPPAPRSRCSSCFAPARRFLGVERRHPNSAPPPRCQIFVRTDWTTLASSASSFTWADAMADATLIISGCFAPNLSPSCAAPRASTAPI